MYADLEPFDEVRGDARAAQVVAAVYNVNRDPKKRRKPYGVEETILRFGDDKPVKTQKTWQQMKAIGQMYAKMYSGVQQPPPRRGKRE